MVRDRGAKLYRMLRYTQRVDVDFLENRGYFQVSDAIGGREY